MHGEPSQRGTVRAERLELILQELDALPTLGAVAVRLLDLTADEDAEAAEVIELISSDPALASRVLALCRCNDRGRAADVTTVDRAVLLIGFEAVRCAVLAVQVFDLLQGRGSLAGERCVERPVFDREGFWLHSLGVAVACEKLAARGTLTRHIRPSEAFIAGLLHDIGQLVLHVLLPESFDQVCRVAETHCASLDRACRQIIGLDTHTAGKRLAEHWGLPKPLVDVIWLNGQPLEAVPQLPHRPLISLVSLADALVRNRYITPGAHWSRNENFPALGVPVGIDLAEIEEATAGLHDDVARRAAALGIDLHHDPAVLLRSICRANESLARANAGMRQREQLTRRQAQTLGAIHAFHESMRASTTVPDVLSAIARSADGAFGTPVVGALFESADSGVLNLVRFAPEYRTAGSILVDPPAGAIPFASLVRDIRASAPVAALMPWLREYLPPDNAAAPLRMMPLTAPGAANAILLFAGEEELGEREDLEPLLECWRAGLASGAQHDSAAHLTEQLAEANRTIHEAQEALARSRTMATLGEVAAGAAHEMNNPLTVISGRSQLLAGRLKDPEERNMAMEIATASHSLSDMITALRSFAEPIEPDIRPLDLASLVVRVVHQCSPHGQMQPRINTILTEPLPAVHADPALLGAALRELVNNAIESKGSKHIELRVQTDHLDGRLKIEVRDDGEGMSEHTLRHAFDPFFSAKPAGRKPGLGLARARRFIEAHGGRINLVNGPSGGAVATIWLDRWREDDRRLDAA